MNFKKTINFFDISEKIFSFTRFSVTPDIELIGKVKNQFQENNKKFLYKNKKDPFHYKTDLNDLCSVY